MQEKLSYKQFGPIQKQTRTPFFIKCFAKLKLYAIATKIPHRQCIIHVKCVTRNTADSIHLLFTDRVNAKNVCKCVGRIVTSWAGTHASVRLISWNEPKQAYLAGKYMCYIPCINLRLIKDRTNLGISYRMYWDNSIIEFYSFTMCAAVTFAASDHTAFFFVNATV